jgi:hypothetical protein
MHLLTVGCYEQQVLIDTYGVISLADPVHAFSVQSAQSPSISSDRTALETRSAHRRIHSR